MNTSKYAARICIVGAGLSLIALRAEAQQGRNPAIIIPPSVLGASESIRLPRLEHDLRYLASDALLGRANPSAGLDTAARYIGRRLAELGLRPFGDESTFFEPVPFTLYRPDAACAHISVDGERFGFADDFGLPSDRQNRQVYSPQSASGSARMVYVQTGWVSPSLGIDPYAHVDVRGAIVVVSALDTAAGPWFAALNSGRPVSDLLAPDVAAASHGAVAMIVIPSWNVIKSWQLARGQRLRTRIIPSLWLPSSTRIQRLIASPALVDAIFAGEVHDARSMVAAALSRNPPPSFALDTAKTLAFDLCLQAIAAKVSNVFALVEGTDSTLKHQYVVIGAHYDGQGLDQPVRGDSIKNAADDNASGSSVVLAIAEALAHGPRPKRSVVLAWFAAEEIGLGAEYHLRHRPEQTAATDLAVILDMVGRPDAGMHTVGGSSSELLDRVMAINRSYLGMAIEAIPAGTSGGSDDDSYMNHSRPFLSYWDDGFLAPGVIEAVADKHSVSDEAEKIDFPLLHRFARTVYVTAWMLANDDRPPR